MSKGKINGYVCPMDHVMVTIDIDEGVTPMFMNCRYKDCGQRSISMMYNVPDNIAEPTFEWYKPINFKKLNPAEKEHVRKGGLLIRKIKK